MEVASSIPVSFDRRLFRLSSDPRSRGFKMPVKRSIVGGRGEGEVKGVHRGPQVYQQL